MIDRLMREFDLFRFAEFVAHDLPHDVQRARERALEVGAQIIQKEARRVIGTYDYGWEQLAESTQADREKKGYPANEPLLRSGEMRDSIHYQIIAKGHLAEIGSDSDVAVYQELGTSTIPARPFLAGAAVKTEKQIKKVVRQMVGGAVAGHRSIEAEILHIAGEALHHLKESAESLVEENDDASSR